jgi:gliding motility-associated-like protein
MFSKHFLKKTPWIWILMFLGIQSTWSQQTLCVGSISTYHVDITENNGQGTLGSIYEWEVMQDNFSGNINLLNASGNQISIDWNDSPAGNYTLVVTETNGSDCASSQSLQVILRPLHVVNLEDKIVCIDPQTGLWQEQIVFATGYNENQFSFQWAKDGVLLTHQGSFLNISEAGTYTVSITNNQTGCVQTGSATVTVAQPLIVTGTIETPFNAVQQISVQVSGGIGPFEYSLNNAGFQDASTFQVTESGLYTVDVRDASGCGTASIELYALDYMKYFTPNGDGVHDYWMVNGLPNPSQSMITIFDRYGKVMYQFKGNQIGWNGQYNGQNVTATDYWFVIDFVDFSGQNRQFKSHFALKR